MRMPPSCCSSHHPTEIREDKRSSILVAAKKCQSQMATVVSMLEEGRYCPEVLQQALSVQGLWKGIIRRIFLNHLKTCFVKSMTTGSPKEQEKTLHEIAHVMELADRS